MQTEDVMPGGRPTKYTAEILEKTREYIEGGFDTFGEVIPTIEGLSGYLDIRVSTLYEWKKDEDKQEFSEALDRLLRKQARLLMSNGLRGSYNPTIAKLLLHGHGHSDAQKTTLAGDPNNPIHTTQSLKEEDREILNRFYGKD